MATARCSMIWIRRFSVWQKMFREIQPACNSRACIITCCGAGQKCNEGRSIYANFITREISWRQGKRTRPANRDESFCLGPAAVTAFSILLLIERRMPSGNFPKELPPCTTPEICRPGRSMELRCRRLLNLWRDEQGGEISEVLESGQANEISKTRSQKRTHG